MRPLRPTREGRWLKILVGEIRTFYGDVALGNGTQYKIGMLRTRRPAEGVFIGIEGRGAYEFQGYAHWGYVSEKLGLKHDGDAMNIADFINTQLGEALDVQGEYDPQYCREEEAGIDVEA